MTAPQEPQSHTPEQALSLARKYMDKYLDADNWLEEPVEKWPQELEDDWRLLSSEWPPARDSAAELRAATTEYLDARQAWRTSLRGTKAAMRLATAEEALRAALAATEGES